MADIFHDFPIRAEAGRVFEAVSTPDGLDRWWTKRSSGEPAEGAEYQLGFGPDHDWLARLRRVAPSRRALPGVLVLLGHVPEDPPSLPGRGGGGALRGAPGRVSGIAAREIVERWEGGP